MQLLEKRTGFRGNSTCLVYKFLPNKSLLDRSQHVHTSCEVSESGLVHPLSWTSLESYEYTRALDKSVHLVIVRDMFC